MSLTILFILFAGVIVPLFLIKEKKTAAIQPGNNKSNNNNNTQSNNNSDVIKNSASSTFFSSTNTTSGNHSQRNQNQNQNNSISLHHTSHTQQQHHNNHHHHHNNHHQPHHSHQNIKSKSLNQSIDSVIRKRRVLLQHNHHPHQPTTHSLNNTLTTMERVDSKMDLNVNRQVMARERLKVIVSIDGGGQLSQTTLAILKRLNSELKDIITESGLNTGSGSTDNSTGNLIQWCDLVVATSTGALISISELLGVESEKVESLITSLPKLLNNNNNNNGISSNEGDSIIPDLLNQSLSIELGKFKPENKMVLVASGKQAEGGGLYHPFLFSNYRNEARSVGNMTLSHPSTVLQALQSTVGSWSGRDREIGNINFTSGSLLFNNPTKLAINEATDLWKDESIKILIISIGSGHTKLNSTITTLNQLHQQREQRQKQEQFERQQQQQEQATTPTLDKLRDLSVRIINQLDDNTPRIVEESIFKSHQEHKEVKRMTSFMDNTSYYRFDPLLDPECFTTRISSNGSEMINLVKGQDCASYNCEKLKYSVEQYFKSPKFKFNLGMVKSVIKEALETPTHLEDIQPHQSLFRFNTTQHVYYLWTKTFASVAGWVKS